MNSLRSRLLISYSMIIGVTLLIVSLALVLLLLQRRSPVQDSYERISTLVFENREHLRGRDIDDALDQFAETHDLWIIRMDADHRVLFDSEDRFSVGEAIPLDIPTNPRRPPGPDNQLRGVFTLPSENVRWAYVLLPVQGAGPNAGQSLVIAQQIPRFRVLAILSDFITPLIQAGVISLILAIILAALISNWVARPLSEMAQSARNIAEGDYSQKAPIKGPSEVRDMANAFNNMVDRVLRTRQAQQDFLANVTHDLKTPLTSIQGYAQAILDGASASPESSAEVIYDEAGRMRRMVDELLELVRLEADQSTLRRELVELDTLLRSISHRLTLKANNKNITLMEDIPPAPKVIGDGDRLAQVFTNLIDNAIIHTPQGGEIKVVLEAMPGGIQIGIRDNGPGIPPEDLNRVFERFYQVEKSRTRSAVSGTGLGLTIAKEIIEAHGGRIWAESTNGNGALFRVWLPLPGHKDATIARPTK